jgi:hypothetical protein
MFASITLLVLALGLWQLDDCEAKGRSVANIFIGGLASLFLVATSSMAWAIT